MLVAKTMIVLVGLAQQVPTTQLMDWSAPTYGLAHPIHTPDTAINLFAVSPHSPSEGIAVDIPPTESKIDQLRAEIHGYGSLDNGWDGANSHAPSVEAIADAIEFTMQLPAGIPVPRAMISTSGEIGLYWNSDGAYVDIAFEDGNVLSIYARDKANGDREQFWDSLPLRSLSPETLASHLSILAA